jgi:transposase
LKDLEAEISTLLCRTNPVITTITGIGDVICEIIVGEIGDILRFESAPQLVAYAGLDVAVKQSGEFIRTQTRISKRGSPYLRIAIWLAATVAAYKDPSLSIIIIRIYLHLFALLNLHKDFMAGSVRKFYNLKGKIY